MANFELEKRTVDLSDKSAGLIRMLSNVLADAGVTFSWINRYKETLAPKTAVNISSVMEYKRQSIEDFANKKYVLIVYEFVNSLIVAQDNVYNTNVVQPNNRIVC